MAAGRDEHAVAFPATHWSLVTRAGLLDSESRRQALEELLVRYLPALRTYLILTRRLQPADAEDLLQDFVAAKVLEKRLISQADPARGKFRTFLLTALDRFRLNRVRDEQARRRSPQDGELLEIGEHAQELPGAAARADAFDVAWAQGIIHEALRQTQQECEQTGRADVWGVFACRVVAPALEDTEPITYDELVQRFHLASPTQAANLLITAKRMYARALRSVVAEYALDAAEIAAEIADLRGVLERRCG